MTPAPPIEWLEAANRLETVANQLVSVVHEVNNMLQIVSGSAEMLGMSASDPVAVRRRADVIGTQAQRAAAMLTEVLAFSRESPEIERVDLRDIVNRALAMRRYAVGRARIEERVEMCAEDAFVRANPRRLLQTVLNLTMGSESRLAGQPNAQLSVALVCEAGQVVLLVEDNSCRTVEADGEVRFAPPLRDPSSPAALGIGVHVAAWMAAEEGGRLSVGPRPDGGATARLSFPAA